jgi:hypothetical protein
MQDGKSGGWLVFRTSWQTFLLGVASILAAEVVQLASPADSSLGFWNSVLHLITDLLRDLGIALIVAVVIVEGIERLSRNEQNREVARLLDKVKTSVLEAVYGTEIANIFFGPFRKVIEHPLLRKQCTFSANLSIWECRDKSEISDNDAVVLDVTLTFILKNCSKQPTAHKIPAFLEKPWPELAARGIPNLGIRSIRVRRSTGETKDLELARASAAKNSRSDLDRVSYEIPLAESESVTVIYSYRLVKFARDTSSLFVTIPTEAMSFDFSFDPRLSLFFTNVHDAEFFDETPAGSPGRLTVRSDGPLFPANGIEFWWMPQRNGEQLQKEAAGAESRIVETGSPKSVIGERPADSAS